MMQPKTWSEPRHFPDIAVRFCLCYISPLRTLDTYSGVISFAATAVWFSIESECRGARALGSTLLLPVVLKRNPWRSVRYVTDGESEKERARERTRLLRRLNSRHYQLSTGAERQQCNVVPCFLFGCSLLVSLHLEPGHSFLDNVIRRMSQTETWRRETEKEVWGRGREGQWKRERETWDWRDGA